MKKIGIVMLSLIMCGCSSAPDSDAKNNKYKDGTYESTAQGYGGDFQIETTLNDDKIKDIVVKDNNETPSIGGVAIEQMIEKMKEKNTYDVDSISGATKTSQAVKAAVKSALEQSENDTQNKDK